MKRLFVATVLLIGMAWIPNSSVATTRQIEFGGFSSDTLSRDIVGGFSGMGFGVFGGNPPVGQLSAGGAPGIGELAAGGTSFGFEFGSQISVVGFGTCIVPDSLNCGGFLLLTNTPFPVPLPFTDFTITVPFSAAGNLTVPGDGFDLVGHGFLTVNEQCVLFCSDPRFLPDFETFATYRFVAPESSTLLLAAVGLSFPIAASLKRRSRRNA